jgi:hypothetical protein
VRVEAGPAVDEQDSRLRLLLGVIPAEQPGQRGVEVAVGKVTGGDIHARRLPFDFQHNSTELLI